MRERFVVAEQFMAGHPMDAARTLETLPPESGAGLLTAIIELTAGAVVLTAMLPYHAAWCLAHLEPAAGARYLAVTSPREAAAILCRTHPAGRAPITRHLPRTHALRVTLLLRYPRTLSDAWMDPHVLSLSADCPVVEAKRRVAEADYAYGVLFVVDDSQRIAGAASLTRIVLHAEDGVPVFTLMGREAGVLSASALLTHAQDALGWQQTDVLPVVNRNGAFLGVLRYADLRRARHETTRAECGFDRSFLTLAEGSCLALADLLTALVGRPRER